MTVTTIIGICGPPGSGKTALALGLKKVLPSASTIFFDHYEKVTQQPLASIVQWLEQGGDCNVFTIPGLSEDLARLRRGAAVTDPRTGSTVQPAKYLLFETPFGRAHRATGAHIDLLLWLDVPLDVALARNVRAFTQDFARPEAASQLAAHMRWLTIHMEEYLGAIRGMLLMQQNTIADAADMRIDAQGNEASVTRNAARELMLAVARREALK